MFKTYKDALLAGEYPVGEPTLNDIVKLPTMHGDSKDGFVYILHKNPTWKDCL